MCLASVSLVILIGGLQNGGRSGCGTTEKVGAVVWA